MQDALEAPTIRAASAEINVLQSVAASETIEDLIALVNQNPLLKTEVKCFNKDLYLQLNNILAKKEKRPKIIKKSLRTLVGLLSRAASRATPSRVIGSVGTIAPADSTNSDSLILDEQIVVTGATSTVTNSSSSTAGLIFRWNPCVVIFGNRCYVTAPRKESVDTFSSVGMNPLLEKMHEWCRFPIEKEKLLREIRAIYPDVDEEIVLGLIDQLVRSEVLLTEDDHGYYNYRKNRGVFKHQMEVAECEELLPSVDNIENLDVDLYRNAKGSVPVAFVNELRSYLNHALKFGAFECNDSGIAKTFAELVLEKYGAARVPLSILIHPVEGIDWRTVKQLHKASAPLSNRYISAVYSLACQRGDMWVDLKEIEHLLPEGQSTYGNFDSLDIMASLHGDAEDPVFNIADAISNISGGVTTARFDSLPKKDIQDPFAVNIDWVSDQKALNSVRECISRFSRTLNVNSVSYSDAELTLADLEVWSDGQQVYVCDKNGNPVRFRPMSMAGVGSYPEWLMQIAIAGTAQTPNINWSWGVLEKNVDYLPGVKFGSVIVSRPAFRYTGVSDVKEFNTWADALNISEWIRIGAADRKLLLNRKKWAFADILETELRRGDGWIYASFPGELDPFVRDADGKAFFAEISQTFNVSSCEKDWSGLKEIAQDLSLVESQADRQVVPAVSDYVNLVVVPRDGFRERVLRTLFAAQKKPQKYYVRYPNSEGEQSFRLRYPRKSDESEIIEQQILQMVRDGILLDVEEKPHSFEFERYGGKESFSLFTEIFALESQIAVQLSNLNDDSAVPDSLHLSLLDWWLNFFPASKQDVIEFATSSQDFEKETHKEASRLVRSAPSSLEKINELEEVASRFSELARDIQKHNLGAYELQSAAHLFCNRLGVSTDREKTLWLALSKSAKRKNNEYNIYN